MEHDRAGHAARSTHHCMLAGYFALQGGEVLSRSCPCRHDWLCRAAAGALPLMGHMMQQGAGQGSADAAHVCRAVPAARAVPAVQRLGGRAAAALLPARPGCRPLRGAGQLGRPRCAPAARLPRRRPCAARSAARRPAGWSLSPSIRPDECSCLRWQPCSLWFVHLLPKVRDLVPSHDRLSSICAQQVCVCGAWQWTAMHFSTQG